MKKKICLICLMTLLITGCGKVPKLSNGKDAVITYKNGDKISVDELYNKMKNNFALESLIMLSDTHILETEFKDYQEKAKEYTEAHTKAFIEQFGDEKQFLAQVQAAGYSTIKAYKEYIYLSYLQSHAVEEYAKSQINEEEIKKYYKDTLKGDVEISHILITPKVKDDMGDEDKKAKEEEAKKLVKEIIAKLKKSSNKQDEFKKLVKKYSQDEATKNKDGSLGKITFGDLDKNYDELIKMAYKLKDGEFSTDIITTELGYHIIYKTKSYEKEPLDKVKDEIKEQLSKDLISSQKDIAIRALQHYRKSSGMKIQDTELNKQYSNYIQNVLISLNSKQEEK